MNLHKYYYEHVAKYGSSFRQDSAEDVVYEHIESERMYALDTKTRKGVLVLPSKPKKGFRALISDRHNTWIYNPLIVHRNGSTIGGHEENLICDTPKAMFVCEYDGQGWQLNLRVKITDFV